MSEMEIEGKPKTELADENMSKSTNNMLNFSHLQKTIPATFRAILAPPAVRFKLKVGMVKAGLADRMRRG
jgi:hypothetical protein